MNKIIFSGVQPSGSLHIGNYIGALKQWKELQNETEAIFCIVDMHAITVPQDPQVLREKILEVAALYLACGIDPEKSHIFVQSENSDHANLAWILNCITPFGQLERMTQFKEKSQKQKEGTTAGLFDYPVLMASDILLYQTDEVPVGEDQKQHIELTRDLAEKFNKTYGEVFKLPVPRIQKETARIMSLQNPNAKMSKSDQDPAGTLNLLESADQIREKVKRAVTDSGTEIKYSQDKPAISNLLTIYSSVAARAIPQIEQEVEGKGYGDFKEKLAEELIKFLQPLQEKYKEIRENEAYLRKVLDEGRDYSVSKSGGTLKKVKELVGLGR
ncbi:MAG: Tryptophan-tRNA ligase [Candidatus Levybacteria bacterium GW2011_GWA1_39_11]|nr:MAG: Tryptophan-tRNA ligase [Candidatus Levybacteria bacterium GW2011_GWA1_39_11]